MGLNVFRVGDIFQTFDNQDSGCISYGFLVDGRRWFVKGALEDRCANSLKRATAFHRAVRHSAIQPLIGTVATSTGPALVYEWFDGEDLRANPSRDRFRSLPVPEVLSVIDKIHDAHLEVAGRGFVAVDFYDGCIKYDFSSGEVRLIDMDEYRPGPFVLEEDRLPGSKRFMAPEEFIRGSEIDEVTNVFTMARLCFVFLSEEHTSSQNWKGSPEMLRVAQQGAHSDRDRRYASLEHFVSAWRVAAGSLIG